MVTQAPERQILFRENNFRTAGLKCQSGYPFPGKVRHVAEQWQRLSLQLAWDQAGRWKAYSRHGDRRFFGVSDLRAGHFGLRACR